jgi:hypothetical protein
MSNTVVREGKGNFQIDLLRMIELLSIEGRGIFFGLLFLNVSNVNRKGWKMLNLL